MINLKEKLALNKNTLGSWITIGHPVIAEIMCQAGFEWLTIDMEHTVIGLEQAQQLIAIIELSGVVPLVRVGDNDPYLIKRVMDAGAQGLIIPMVNSQAEAERAVAAAKYPPIGVRGVGLARAQKYGYGFEEYKQWLSEEGVVIVQIEHINAINQLESILSAPGVDGSIIGPYDLSGSMGFPGEFTRPEMREALNYYENTCRKMGKPMGFHVVQPNPQEITEYIERGYAFLAAGVDMLYLGSKCREILKTVKGNVCPI